MMDLLPFFRSVLDQDRAPVVLCDLEHTVIYLNPAAEKRYAGRPGTPSLLGQSLLRCHSRETGELIERVVGWFAESKDHNIVYESRNDEEDKDVYMVALRGGEGELIGYYEKHEYRARETAPFYDLR